MGGGREQWRMMLCFAVIRLGLSPDAFWRLPVCEWCVHLSALAPQGMTRDALADLMKTYGGDHA